MEKLFTKDQARGMLVGLAVGDALGTTLEFTVRDSVRPIDDMVGGGPFRLKPGQWTDDTSMALCLGEALRVEGVFDGAAVMRRFVNWRDSGYLSSTGECFDIGIQTSMALNVFLDTSDPNAGPADDGQSGNGGIMRLAPVVLAYGFNVEKAAEMAKAQSRLTHASPSCLAAAEDMARFLVSGDRALLPTPDVPPDEATGWVKHTLHASHWALTQGATFRDVLLSAVNLGGDADTVGAVVGQMAGRIWGYDGIPQQWRAKLHDHDWIVQLADDLYALGPDDI